MPVGLVVDIKGDTSNLDSALTKSKGGIGGLGSSIGALANPAMLATAGIAAAGVAIVAMTDAAAADRDEQAKLETAIKASGAAHGDWAAQVDAAIAAGQEKAFTDSETRAGLEALTVATGDVGQATDLLTLAQDVARKSGVSLEDASKAVAKAHAGSDGALRKLIPGMKKGATTAETLAEAERLAAGQADNYANSAEGMKAKGADAFGEIGETIGSAFLPVMDEVLPLLIPIIKQFGTLIKSILPIIIPLIKVLAKGLGLVATVLGTIIGWLIKLVTWLGKAIGKIGTFLDSINPFKGIKLPSLPFLNAAPAGGATTTRAARGAGGGGGGAVTVNVYGALDPEATARQIRRVLAGHSARVGTAAI
jgi:hypothetical protein